MVHLKLNNFIREPEITLLSGSNGQLKPIVGKNGDIIEVIVENKGTNYNSPPNLQISGDGLGAVITPVLKVIDLNGNASSVGIGTTINYVLDSVKYNFMQELDILKIILRLMLLMLELIVK